MSFFRRTEPEQTDAEKALEDARAQLDDIESQWPEVHRLSVSLRHLRERNHFGDAIESIMKGHQ